MIIRICSPIYTYSFQQNWHDHKKFWRFHQVPPPHPTPLPPLVMGGEDAMILNGLGQLLFSSLLSMLLPMVFRFTVKDFIWMEEPSTFLKNEQNEKVQKCEELHKVTKAAFTGYF